MLPLVGEQQSSGNHVTGLLKLQKTLWQWSWKLRNQRPTSLKDTISSGTSLFVSQLEGWATQERENICSGSLLIETGWRPCLSEVLNPELKVSKAPSKWQNTMKSRPRMLMWWGSKDTTLPIVKSYSLLCLRLAHMCLCIRIFINFEHKPTSFEQCILFYLPMSH